ncbi:MAG: 50S ribosomal protein L25 [Spirochaetaceae bacterium]|nr:50S ribosomal protein L25 [Spirochaetaceae bacterium]
MSRIVLKARNRTANGSAEARRIRRNGRIPAVMYGRTGQAKSIDLDALEFTNGIKNITDTTIVTVDVEGETREAFVKNTQRTITDGKILHVDFYEVEAGALLRAKVKLYVQGNPVGVRDGGTLEVPIRDVEVECLPKDLPPKITVDVSGLKANQSIYVRDLALGEGVRTITGGEQVVAVVKFAKAEAAETPAPEAAPAEAAPAKAEAKS